MIFSRIKVKKITFKKDAIVKKKEKSRFLFFYKKKIFIFVKFSNLAVCRKSDNFSVRFFCAVCNARRPVIRADVVAAPVWRAAVSACKRGFRLRYAPTAFYRGCSYNRGIGGLLRRGYPP